jgi:hypothetical protein
MPGGVGALPQGPGQGQGQGQGQGPGQGLRGPGPGLRGQRAEAAARPPGWRRLLPAGRCHRFLEPAPLPLLGRGRPRQPARARPRQVPQQHRLLRLQGSRCGRACAPGSRQAPRPCPRSCSCSCPCAPGCGCAPCLCSCCGACPCPFPCSGSCCRAACPCSGSGSCCGSACCRAWAPRGSPCPLAWLGLLQWPGASPRRQHPRWPRAREMRPWGCGSAATTWPPSWSGPGCGSACATTCAARGCRPSYQSPSLSLLVLAGYRRRRGSSSSSSGGGCVKAVALCEGIARPMRAVLL